MSLERKLPLLVTAVLVATLATAVALAYREVRHNAIVAASSRIETVGHQLVVSSTESITNRDKLLHQVAESPAVLALASKASVDAGAAVTPAEHAAAAVVMHRLVLPTDSTLAIELWSAHGQLLQSLGDVPEAPASAHDTPPTVSIPGERTPQTAMPRDSNSHFLPFFEGRDHRVYYWITVPVLGLNVWQAVCFLIFWLMQFYFIVHGIDSIRRLETYTAPIKVVICVMLLIWAYDKAGGFGPTVHRPSEFGSGAPQSGRFYAVFWPSLTAMVGFWSTLALNIPDFTRFARSQRDQIVGQAIGLPAPMGLLAALAVFVTSATVVIYGKAIWDPVTLAGRMTGAAVLIALLVLLVDTISVNLAANLVGPAFDFASLSPRRISYRAWGYITALIAIVMMPWKILSSNHGYIATWLVGYSALLGSVAGILIVDYYHLRRRQIDVPGLYRLQGSPYFYRRGWNPIAVGAFLAGVVPCLPGFVHVSLPQALPHLDGFLSRLYDYAWFVALGLSAVVYAAGMRLAARGSAAVAAPGSWG